MSSSDLLNSAYQALARRAWDTNRARAAELAGVLAAWRQSELLSDEQREHARRLAHSLRGSAGTFGHGAAAEAAGELQESLTGGDTLSIELVAGLVERIESELEQEPQLEL